MTTSTQPASTPRRGRRVRRLVVAALILVGLLVAADFGVAAAAEYQVAQKMRAKLQLAEDPAVRINGFPFITQALSGDYRDIEISASGVPVRDQLRDLEVRANLYHTRIGLSELLAGDTRNATIDAVRGSVKIKASDLNRLADQVTPFTDMSIEPDTRDEVVAAAAAAPAGPSTTAAVQLSGKTTIAGRALVVTAYGTVSLIGGQVEIAIDDVALDDESLRAAIPQLVQALNIKIDPGALPFTVTPTAVRVESGAFTLEGTVTDIPLDGSTTR
jgi:hypothetical protein